MVRAGLKSVVASLVSSMTSVAMPCVSLKIIELLHANKKATKNKARMVFATSINHRVRVKNISLVDFFQLFCYQVLIFLCISKCPKIISWTGEEWTGKERRGKERKGEERNGF